MRDEVVPTRRPDAEDVAVVIGIVLLVVGAFLAWPPAAFILAGVSILAIVRYGAAGE